MSRYTLLLAAQVVTTVLYAVLGLYYFSDGAWWAGAAQILVVAIGVGLCVHWWRKRRRLQV